MAFGWLKIDSYMDFKIQKWLGQTQISTTKGRMQVGYTSFFHNKH
jgi:hypothetical protein